MVTDGAQRVLGSQSGMATITQVMSGISVKLKEAIWLLLASARQKPVDNRAEFFHSHFSQFALSLCLTAICAVMLCSAMDAPKGHDNFVGNNS